MRLLVTGGCGFIGSNFIRWLLSDQPDVSVINLDRLTYAAAADMADVASSPRYRFVLGSICNRALVETVLSTGVDACVHFAAESHVDRSLQDSGPFVLSNVVGTQVLLDACRRAGVARFVHVSTDEVYGTLGPTGQFTENSPLQPNSPYAASKAAADCLVRSYCQSFGFPAVITRCSNNYGPWQHPEKLIPKFVTAALQDQSLTVYGTGVAVRDWIHVSDHCRGVWAALERGVAGEVYNFGGRAERSVLEIAHLILAHLHKPLSLIEFVGDRPGHDLRYAIDCTRAETELGWSREWNFAAGLRDTIRWYAEHQAWAAQAVHQQT